MPQTQPDGQNITEKLSQAIREMRDFLLANLSDENYYKILYDEIEKLNTLVRTKGYVGYEHKNPHKTFAEFLNAGETSKYILKYYSEPIFKKDIIKNNRILKIVDGIIKRAERIAGVIGKVIK